MEQTQEVKKSKILEELVDKGCMLINAKIFQYGLCVEPAKDNAQGALAVDIKFLSGKEGIGPKDLATLRVNNVNGPMDVLHKFGHVYEDMEMDVGNHSLSYKKLKNAIKTAYQSLKSDKPLKEKLKDLQNQFNNLSKETVKEEKKEKSKSTIITLKPKKKKDGREVYEAEL